MDTVAKDGQAATDGAEVDLIGGVLCLDFVNTVEPRVAGRPGGRPRDRLTNYGALVDWSRHASTITEAQAARLLARGARRPAAAEVALAEAAGLREAMYRVFYAIATQGAPDGGDLNMLGTAYAAAAENMRLQQEGNQFSIAWDGEPDDLTRPLWPIARSAVELLLSADPARLKHCDSAGAGCGRLFYDTSKNNSRRWCSMRGCGGTAKERRRAERRRNSSPKRSAQG